MLTLADSGSKLASSSDEYGISDSDLLFLQNSFSLTISVDAMASKPTRRAQKYIAAAPQEECLDVDFFLSLSFPL